MLPVHRASFPSMEVMVVALYLGQAILHTPFGIYILFDALRTRVAKYTFFSSNKSIMSQSQYQSGVPTFFVHQEVVPRFRKVSNTQAHTSHLHGAQRVMTVLISPTYFRHTSLSITPVRLRWCNGDLQRSLHTY